MMTCWIRVIGFFLFVLCLSITIGAGYMIWTSTTGSQTLGGFFWLIIGGSFTLTIGSVFFNFGDVPVEVRPALHAIREEEKKPWKEVEHTSSSSDYRHNRKPSSYKVYQNKVQGKDLYIARNNQTGLYDVIVDGKLLAERETGKTAGKRIIRFFHIDPETLQKPLPPADAAGNGKGTDSDNTDFYNDLY